MANDIRNGDGWRTQPMYTISEAAHLAHVAPVTVKRWLYGYRPDSRFPEWRSPPVFGEKDATNSYVSFLQLMEIRLAADFRKVGHVKLDVVRRAHENARTRFEIEYPFAHKDLKLQSLGGHIVYWLHDNTAQAIDSEEQSSIPGLIKDRMSEVDYERDLAARWYPDGKLTPIVVDPRFGSGVPTIVGRGVAVNTIYKRWKAHQPISFIADDLELESDVVERALRYADQIAA